MWALGIGAIGAWLRYHNRLSQSFFLSWWTEILMFATLGFVFSSGESLSGFILYPVVNLFFVIKAACFRFNFIPVEKLLKNKRVVFVGKISYGVYLYHILVLHFFNEFLFDPFWNAIPFNRLGFFSKLQYNATLIKFPFVTLLTIAVAYLSYRYLESPLLRLKNRLFAIA